MHEKQHFRKNAERKYHIFRKMKINENMIFSIISDIFRKKSIKQDHDKKENKY